MKRLAIVIVILIVVARALHAMRTETHLEGTRWAIRSGGRSALRFDRIEADRVFFDASNVVELTQVAEPSASGSSRIRIITYRVPYEVIGSDTLQIGDGQTARPWTYAVDERGTSLSLGDARSSNPRRVETFEART